MNITQYVTASIIQYFNIHKNSLLMKTMIDEPNNDVTKDSFEVRIDGPLVRRHTKNHVDYYFDVMIFLQVENTDADRFKTASTADTFIQLFVSIPVYKYGSNPDDDSTFIDCLELVKGTDIRAGDVRVTHLGRITTATNKSQVILEARYKIQLES